MESSSPQAAGARRAEGRATKRVAGPASSWRGHAPIGSGLYFSELFRCRGSTELASSLRRSPRLTPSTASG